MSINKKKAFTLTELLVVVVIIGVLAAVVLPKFNKVVETRKTTEAEELMAAVRTEQEYRCAMDKPYIGDINLSQIIPQASTKNFTYQLKGTGMLASSRSKSYELKMLSYADGRICCAGTACKDLNKDYPKCDDLKDLRVATECTATLPDPNPDPDPNPCTEEQVLRRACAGCGWQTRTVKGCVNGHWEYSDWTGSCRSAQTETYDCASKEPGTTGTKTRTEVCDEERGVWYYPETWTGSCEAVPCKGEPVLREACGEGMCGWKTREVTECVNGEWQYTEWDDTCRTAETQTDSCGEGYKGNKTRTEVCDEASGEWRYPDTWEEHCEPIRWLSPLSFCDDHNGGLRETETDPEKLDSLCTYVLGACVPKHNSGCGPSLRGGFSYTSIDSPIAVYECELSPSAASFITSPSSQQIGGYIPADCTPGGACPTCVPGKRYYSRKAFCSSCVEEGISWAPEHVRRNYEVPYAICKEADAYPFKCYPTANCKVQYWQNLTPGAVSSVVLQGEEWVPVRDNLPCLQQ